VIVTPNVLGSIKKYRNKMYDTQLNNIISAAKNWAADELERKHCLICVPEDNSSKTDYQCSQDGGEGCKEADQESNTVLTVTLGTLQDNGYIDDDLENPKTNKSFNKCIYVEIKRDSETGEFLYTIPNPDLDTECTDYDSGLSVSSLISYSISSSGWAQSKTLTINYPTGYTNEYSIDGGKTWNKYSKALTFTANGTVIARVTDEAGYITEGSTYTIEKIDSTKPTSASFTYTKTSSTITVTAKGTDTESGISNYSFKITSVSSNANNTSSSSSTIETVPSTTNSYTFTVTSGNTYSITVTVWDKAGNYLESAAQSITIE
jgi:hypothetical protein